MERVSMPTGIKLGSLARVEVGSLALHHLVWRWEAPGCFSVGRGFPLAVEDPKIAVAAVPKEEVCVTHLGLGTDWEFGTFA
jgi:hypothetical protein